MLQFAMLILHVAENQSHGSNFEWHDQRMVAQTAFLQLLAAQILTIPSVFFFPTEKVFCLNTR